MGTKNVKIMISLQSIDRLKQGLQAIVSESRSSLSDEQIVLLKDCIALLEALEQTGGHRRPEAEDIVSNIVLMLLRVLLSEDIHRIAHILHSLK